MYGIQSSKYVSAWHVVVTAAVRLCSSPKVSSNDRVERPLTRETQSISLELQWQQRVLECYGSRVVPANSNDL